jgi:hypothetical protein
MKREQLIKAGLTVNLKRNLDLGLTPRSGRNVGQVELAEHVVVLGHRSFTLINLDGNGRLVVDGSGKDLGLLGGHNGVPGAVGSSRYARKGSVRCPLPKVRHEQTNINLVMTPPVVSIPMVKGQTSINKMSELASSPLKIPP